MTAGGSVAEPAHARPGRLSRALIRLFMKGARVKEAMDIADGFRLISLESAMFEGIEWIPGQKVQVAMGSAFVARTFTPIDWDAEKGTTRILGYAHGDGPGSAWVRACQPGDACDVFGPRASLDLDAVTGPCVLLGDETSIGLAYAASRRTPSDPPPCLFEVVHAPTAHTVLTHLGLDAAEVFERRPDDAHLADMERRLRMFVATGATFVLTGRAPCIQRLRRALKEFGVPASRLVSKPYWAPGRTGLD